MKSRKQWPDFLANWISNLSYYTSNPIKDEQSSKNLSNMLKSDSPSLS